MLRRIRIALLGLLAVFALMMPALAQSADQRVIATDPGPPGYEIDSYVTATLPALSGRVVDAAGVLDPANRKALVTRLEALEAATGDQLVVATVASLHGNPIESYANRLFNIWKLGQKDNNNGVLLLVAPSERKVRIEVGYGLEGTLTDAVAKLIIEQSIVPHFRAGDFAGGIAQGADDVAQVLTGGTTQWQRHAAADTPIRDERALARGEVIMYVIFAVAAAAATFAGYILLWFFLRFLIVLHLLPQRNHRNGFWRLLDKVDADLYDTHGRRIPRHSDASHSSDSSGASVSSSSSFSGGGGSSGGGGASGSW